MLRSGFRVSATALAAPVAADSLRGGGAAATTAALLAIGTAIAMCVAASSARAQAAPTTGDAIIRAMHDRYAKTWYHTLSFTQKTTRRTDADTMVVETWKETALLPGRLRIDIASAKGPDITATYSGDSVFVVRHDSTIRRVAQRNILLIIGFDVYGQPVEKTLADLESQHFPMTPVREDTWEGRSVYVIGASAGDLHASQLWIDKQRLLFVRALEPNGKDTTKTDEYRFDDYVPQGGGWLSEKVEMLTDQKLAQREEYHDVRTNVPVDPKIFVAP